MCDCHPEPIYCDCTCHDGAAIHCSCFGPCCPQPYVVRAELKPLRRHFPEIKLNTKFVFPIIKRQAPKLIADDIVNEQRPERDTT